MRGNSQLRLNSFSFGAYKELEIQASTASTFNEPFLSAAEEMREFLMGLSTQHSSGSEGKDSSTPGKAIQSAVEHIVSITTSQRMDGKHSKPLMGSSPGSNLGGDGRAWGWVVVNAIFYGA